MKKMRIIPLTAAAVLASISGMFVMNAQTFTEQEIKDFAKVEGIEGAYDNVYIIGKHMFKNVISLNDIMTASRTLGEGDPNVIYLRSTEGEWTNAMDGKSVEAPTSFEIIMADYKPLEDTEVNTKLTQLKKKVEDAKYVEKEYTKESYKALTDALAMAETTNEEKNAKLVALTAAVNGLTFANQEALDNLKQACEVAYKNESDYEASSYRNFKTTYENIKDLSEKTYAEVQKKIDSLTIAKDSLVSASVNTDNLKKELVYSATDGVTVSGASSKISAQGDYTEESWKNFVDVRTKAKAIYDNANSLQSDVNKALENLEAARKALVFKGMANLEEAKDIADLTETDYTEESWKALKDLLDADKLATYADNDAVVAATEGINTARAQLILKSTYKSYESIKNTASIIETNRSQYDYIEGNTETTYAKFATKNADLDVEALKNTVDHTSKKNLNDLILEKIAELNKAIDELKFKDQDRLIALIKEHKNFAVNKADYTEESWAAYEKAIEKVTLDETIKYDDNFAILSVITKLESAETLLDSTNIITEESLTKLTAGINNEFIDGADRSKYNILKSQDAQTSNTTYVDELWTAYDNAIDAAIEIETLFDGLTATDGVYDISEVESAAGLLQSDMEKAINDIADAKSKLIKISTKNAIDAYKTKGLVESQYTESTWATYKTAIETKYENQTEAENTLKKIETAYKNLVFDNKATLDSLKDISGLNKDDYTEETWKALTDAIKGTVNAKGEPTGEDEDTYLEIDNKIQAIREAKKALETIAHKNAVESLVKFINNDYAKDYVQDNDAYKAYVALLDGIATKDADSDPETYTANESAIKALSVEEIDAKLSKLEEALNNLTPLSVEELDNLVKAIEALKVEDYTEESYNTFMTAYNTYMKEYNEGVKTNTAISLTIKNITTAQKELKLAVVDTETLNKLQTLVDGEYTTNAEGEKVLRKTNDEGYYDETSYTNYKNAIKAVEDYLALKDGNEQKIYSNANTVYKKLQTAIEELKPAAQGI